MDTIEVREDEKFNEVQLAHYLQGKLEGSDLSLEIKQFGGGAANLTYLLRFGRKFEYVLRRPPLGPVAKSAHDMGREFKVLSKLYKKFEFAPKALLYCDDLNVIGSNFFIMERRNGIVIRNHFPNEFSSIPNVGKKISESLIDRLVELHSVDFKSLNLKDLGKPEGFIERQVHGWFKRWTNAKVKELPDMDVIYNWLKENIPISEKISIIHNDYKLDNIMLRSDDITKIEAIFDWDMCTLGDPYSDLGSLLAYWYDPRVDPEYTKQISTMPINPELGFYTRKDLINRYELKSGKSIQNITFYHVLGLFRLSVIIAQIYFRYVKGLTQDSRFKGFGNLIPLLTRSALEIVNNDN